MKRRWSKRVREQAADILAICASTPGWTWQAEAAIAASKESDNAASEALLSCFDSTMGDSSSVWYAEAEAMLRTGWEP